MLENRSYDNILGWLYQPSNAAPYNLPPAGQANLNGLSGNNVNPNPADPAGPPLLAQNQFATTDVNGTLYPATANPVFDPGEWFGDMAQQITGSSSLVTSNPYAPDASNPYQPQAAAAMQGFTLNYANPGTFPGTPVPPTGTNPADVINYFTPAQLPVTAFLAANYGVCDQWFGSAPAQTYVNRAFALTAGPLYGTLDGTTETWTNDYWLVKFGGGGKLSTVPSLLDQLDTVLTPQSPANANWKVYFHDYCLSMVTVGYVSGKGASSDNINVSTVDTTDYPDMSNGEPGVPPQLGALPATFLADLTAGSLPAFSFIEPRYFLGYASFESAKSGATTFYAPNSNHPGSASYPPLTGATGNRPPNDVMSGELLLLEIYNALVGAVDSNGNAIWDETLLVVTYDENGGMYDHVPPPAAVPPGQFNGTAPITIPAASDTEDPAAANFGWNVLGPRVPAIVASGQIAQGSTVRDAGGAPFDHTSIISTAFEVFGLATKSTPSLTSRDAAAPTLVPFLAGSGVNDTGPFSGAIVANPSFLTFAPTGTPYAPQLIVVSAGTNALNWTTATSWLNVTATTTTIGPTSGPTYLLTLSVSVATENLPTTPATGTITVVAENIAEPFSITVTLNG